jgi:hypothetical protein
MAHASLADATHAVLALLLNLGYVVLFSPLAWVLRRFCDVLDQDWDAQATTYFETPLGSK